MHVKKIGKRNWRLNGRGFFLAGPELDLFRSADRAAPGARTFFEGCSGFHSLVTLVRVVDMTADGALHFLHDNCSEKVSLVRKDFTASGFLMP
jgi:hypothetical protein